MNDCQLARSTQDTSCCISLQVESDSNGHAICGMLVWWCLCVCLQGYLEVNDSWYLVFDRYIKEILRRNGRLVMFVSTHSRDLTWNIRELSCHNVRWVFPFQPKWRSKCRFCFDLVDQTFEPWHKWLSLPPCGPYLATSNISPNKVKTRYNGKCGENELFPTSGGQIRQIDKDVHATKLRNKWGQERHGGRKDPSIGRIAQLAI